MLNSAFLLPGRSGILVTHFSKLFEDECVCRLRDAPSGSDLLLALTCLGYACPNKTCRALGAVAGCCPLCESKPLDSLANVEKWKNEDERNKYYSKERQVAAELKKLKSGPSKMSDKQARDAVFNMPAFTGFIYAKDLPFLYPRKGSDTTRNGVGETFQVALARLAADQRSIPVPGSAGAGGTIIA